MQTNQLTPSEELQILRTLNKEWQEFCARSNNAEQEKQGKGAVDPLNQQAISGLNDSIQKNSDLLQKARISAKRPVLDPEHRNMYSDMEAQYSEAFCNYLRKGQEIDLEQLQVKSVLNTGKEAGYRATTRMLEQINHGITIASPLRRLARVTQIAGEVLELVEDASNNASGWTQEAESVFQATTLSQLHKQTISVHELYTQPKATQRFLEDPIIDIESWLSAKLSDAFIRKENTAFISGDGVGKPRGILHYDKEKDNIVEVETGTENGLNIEAILDLCYSLPALYSPQAKLLISREALQALRMLKNPTTGNFIWQPSASLGAPDTILGIEVVMCTDMPAMIKGAKIAVLADFQRAYQIVDCGTVRVLRDPYTEKPYTKFYTTKRVGADLVDKQALRVLVVN